MTTWPFSHDWGSTYNVTLSYKTDVLVSRSGIEQRRAMRYEPRRTLETAVTVDGRSMRDLDRFLWSVKQQTFAHVDPQSGVTRTVRLPQSQSITHKTSGVSEMTVDLAVDPGTETFDTPQPDASFTYKQRYVFPLPINWRDGITDAYSDGRETVDFDRGRISVSLPVPFSTRQSTETFLVEDDTLETVFRWARGRQGEFWTISATDDLNVVSLLGTNLIVEGDVVGLYTADNVHRGLWLEFPSGMRYLRTVTGAAHLSSNTLLSLDEDFYLEDTLPRRATWAFVTRFASDDLTVQWVTTTVAESSVQFMTLPTLAPEPIGFDDDVMDFIDYFGYGFDGLFIDPLNYIVNVQLPWLTGGVFTRDWWQDGLEYVVNVDMPQLRDA